jgi:mono/diheme cytochrome c family protein
MRIPTALSWLLLALAAGALVTACGGEDEPDAAGATADGETLYAMHCAACHGEQGVGTDAGPPLVHIVYEPSHHDDESFRRAVRDGVVPHHWGFGPMPPVPAVADDQVDAIIAYVREIQREAGIQ